MKRADLQSRSGTPRTREAPLCSTLQTVPGAVASYTQYLASAATENTTSATDASESGSTGKKQQNGKKNSQTESTAKRWQGRRRRAESILRRTIAHLRRRRDAARKNRDFKEASEAAFAAMILRDLETYGKPGLILGMYYDEKFNYIGPSEKVLVPPDDSAK